MGVMERIERDIEEETDVQRLLQSLANLEAVFTTHETSNRAFETSSEKDEVNLAAVKERLW